METPSAFMSKHARPEHASIFHCELETVAECEGGVFRTPRYRNSDPQGADDSTLDYAKINRIGSTGWNWVEKQSEWFDYDIDGLNHSGGLSEAELREVIESLPPWVTAYRSKSGKGIHLRIKPAEPMPAATGNQHDLNGRAYLDLLCTEVVQKIDGKTARNAWLWAIDAAPNGFDIIREATANPPPLPPSKPLPFKRGAARGAAGPNTLSIQQTRLIEAIVAVEGYCSAWDNAAGIFRCHTKAVERAGLCKTDSPGKDGIHPNAFIVAIDGGLLLKTWRKESGSGWWEKDGKSCLWVLKPDDNALFAIKQDRYLRDLVGTLLKTYGDLHHGNRE